MSKYRFHSGPVFLRHMQTVNSLVLLWKLRSWF